MFTVFVESAISDENRPVLKGAADIFVEKAMTGRNSDPLKSKIE